MDHIAALDAFLLDAGTDVTLSRKVSGVEQTVTVRAAVRVVNKPDPNIAGSTQSELRCIMSTTQIIAAGWPSGQSPTGSGFRVTDPQIPANGDRIYYNGLHHVVQYTNAIRVNNVVVRMEVYAKGNIGGV